MHRSLHAHSDESSDEAEDGSDDAADTDKLLEVATCSCIAISTATTIDLATCWREANTTHILNTLTACRKPLKLELMRPRPVVRFRV